VEFLRAFIQGSLEPAVLKLRQRLQAGEQPVMVATSGTAMAIAAMAAAEDPRPPLRMQGYRVSRQRLDQLVTRLLALTPEQRRAIPGLNERRAEIIVPGALILQTAMGMLGARELVISERALREGLIVDWMLRNDLIVDRFAFQSSIRQRTVLHQVQRYGVDQARAERVAGYALSLYVQSQGLLHHDDGSGRQLLWAAAMLHSCGQHINIGAYHKHSWYLIRHGDLLGYSDSEHLMVAAIARYHRRSLPKKRHEAWQLIDGREQRRTVASMALLLRLAAALDRRPQATVAGIQVRRQGENICAIRLEPMAAELDLSLERWSLQACEPAVEESLGVRLRVLEPEPLSLVS
jgi:exopolyphosphatase/guanosine-5'-triphosphate,3'-diphosphate pyrophosphatase